MKNQNDVLEQMTAKREKLERATRKTRIGVESALEDWLKKTSEEYMTALVPGAGWQAVEEAKENYLDALRSLRDWRLSPALALEEAIKVTNATQVPTEIGICPVELEVHIPPREGDIIFARAVT